MFLNASGISRLMHSTRGMISVVALSAISVAFLWLTDIPLGVPGEWTWARIPIADAEAEVALGAVQSLIAGVVYILVAWLGSRRIANCSRAELAGWLLGIAVIGFGWMLAVQESPPSGRNLSKAAFVLYYPGSSGYFHKARYEIPDTAKFLHDYEDLMAEGDVLHVGTHPPGLFLLYQKLIDEMEQRPTLAEFIANTSPQSVADSFDIVDTNLRRSGKELTTADRAVIWLVTMLTQACCVLAVVPIFLLMRQSHTRNTSWRAAAFWPLLPALAIFIPKSDVLFVLPAALLTWTWLSAARRQSFLLGIVAGAIGWAGLFCSLAFLPVGLIAFAASLLATVSKRENEAAEDPSFKSVLRKFVTPVSLWQPILGGVGAMGGLTLIVSLLCEMNLLNVWIHNYQNHAGFYAKFTRTVWKWWLVNPLELIFAVGVPVSFLLARSAFRRLTHWRTILQHPLLVSFLTVWTLLWLSGKNSGEAARLWNPLLPALLVAAAGGLTANNDSSNPDVPDEDSDGERAWLVLLSCQAAVCAATVIRVSGFHF
jgi:methylthioxylose transferase